MEDWNGLAESICASLVREYLHIKRLKTTLTVLDKEMPRNVNSINSRKTLLKQLKIETIMEANKNSINPLKSIIEVLIKHFLHSTKSRNVMCSENDNKTSEEIIRSEIVSEKLLMYRNFKLVDFSQLKFVCNTISQVMDTVELIQFRKIKIRSYRNEGRHGMERDEKGEPTSELNHKYNYDQKGNKQYRDKAASRLRDKEHVLMSSLSISESSSSSTEKSTSKKEESKSKLDKPSSKSKQKDSSNSDQKYGLNIFRRNNSEIPRGSENYFLTENKEGVLDGSDIKTVTVDVNESIRKSLVTDLSSQPKKNADSVSQERSFFTPLRIEVGYQLKRLLIGTGKKFPSQWMGQSFVFNNNHKIRYGLVQTKGGCCGVLATVQAFVLKALLYGENKSENVDPLRPTRNEVRSALVQGLSDILWQAGPSHAVLAIADTETSEVEFSFERMLGYLTYKEFTSKKKLEEGIANHLDYFTTFGSNGCLLFVISVVLSRGIQSVVGDMDDESCSLIGDNGFCSLELVNLLLTGHAVSNVFDNSLQIDSCTLRGIISRADIGFLSLYEYFNSCQVGSNLKTPRYPIWVVNSENHFTVLFSCQKELVTDWKAERQFSLYHYDAMHSNIDVKLTIDTTGLYETNTYEGENVPPLEHCIRTKWKDAVIKWNC